MIHLYTEAFFFFTVASQYMFTVFILNNPTDVPEQCKFTILVLNFEIVHSTTS